MARDFCNDKNTNLLPILSSNPAVAQSSFAIVVVEDITKETSVCPAHEPKCE